ncbi:MAG: energy-coupling factor ABC transporter ATP-binding protein [Treponema sp.]|nr:energy-coupling factor ABC transporter ATP-binding protein [Treponema sp.]
MTGNGADRPVFQAKGLSRVFARDGGETAALRDINLVIEKGECLLLAGSNGSGKTLLMRCLAGLLEPSSGEILYRGEPLSRVKDLHRRVGIVFQDPDSQIVGETIEEDIAFGPFNSGLPKSRIRELTELALRTFGLEDKRDVPPRRLSGGEKRRLAAAGIFAMGCETVIMDEPFANLDYPGVLSVLSVIRGMKGEGRTLVILTHELEKVLALAKRLVILHRGTIRDDGEPEMVLDRLRDEWGVRDPRQTYSRVQDCSWLGA